MRIPKSLAVLGLALLIPSHARCDEPLPAASVILERCEAAVAPERRSEEIAMIMRGRVPQEDGNGPAWEQVFDGAQRAKYTVELAGGGRRTEGCTEAFSWSVHPTHGARMSAGDDRLAQARSYAVERRAPWHTLYKEAKTVGRTEVEGRAHYDLAMTPIRGGGVDHWLIDCETHLPTALVIDLPGQDGVVRKVRFVYSNWDEMGGVLLANRKRIECGDSVVEVEFELLMATGFVEDEKLAPPPEVVALYEQSKAKTDGE